MARSRKLGYGEGSIYQQCDGRWRGELRLGPKRRRVSAWTRSEVIAKLDELRAKSSAGLPLGTDMRLGEWLDWYQEMIDAEKNPSTCANCAWVIKQLTPLRGRRLRELDVLEFESLLKDLANPARGKAATKGRGGRKRPLSKSSLNRIKMVLGAALHEAERRGLVARNVARLAHLPPEATGLKARRSLTIEEANRFVDAVRGTEDEALVLLALTMGLRPGEVTGLSWDAVDLDEGVLTVRQALKRLPDGTYVLGAPKVDSYRTLRLPSDLVGVLRRASSGPAQGAPVRRGVGGPWTRLHQRPRATHRRLEPAPHSRHLREEGERGAPLPQRAPTFRGLAARRQRDAAPGRLGPARSSRHPDAGPDLPAQDPLGRRRHERPGAHAPRVSMLAPRDPKRLPCANSGGGSKPSPIGLQTRQIGWSLRCAYALQRAAAYSMSAPQRLSPGESALAPYVAGTSGAVQGSQDAVVSLGQDGRMHAIGDPH